MIISREIWIVREGHSFAEAMELFKDFPTGGPKATRVLSPGMVHQGNATLIFEFEYDSLGAMEKQWTEWVRGLGGRAYMERWYAVCERNSHSTEVWVVVQ